VRIPWLLLTAAAIAALLSGAVPSGTAAAEPVSAEQLEPAPVFIYVQNQTGRTLNISLQRGGGRIVLGRLGQGERRRFELASGTVTAADLRLIATRLGERFGLESESFQLEQGQEIAWHIRDAPGSRAGIGWGMLVNGAPRDAHRYASRG
jgi:hypothetical protein